MSEDQRVKTTKERHGPDFYSRIAKKSHENRSGYAFQDREFAREMAEKSNKKRAVDSLHRLHKANKKEGKE